MNSGRLRSRLANIDLFDVLHQFANLLKRRLDLDHCREMTTSPAFEPIVFVSRNISWVRNSSLRPGPSFSVFTTSANWSRWLPRRITSSATSLRSAKIATSRSRLSSLTATLLVAQDLRHPFLQPAFDNDRRRSGFAGGCARVDRR